MNKPKFETPDMVEKNIEKLAELFPNCVTEARGEDGKLKKAVNFEMLQQILSTELPPEGAQERYEFTWVGKRAAIAEANKPIRKTLRPCKAESKNWDTTENLYIEGDNLEVLKLLQESYLGKVKMIYIDPPYNTGNDFIYRDDFKQTQEEYNKQNGLFDEDDNRLFKNTETNGRFHSDWCSMVYSRLMLAKNFLSDDGVIFISIDDNEIYNILKLCNDVFGEINFVSIFIWEKKKKPSFLDRNVGKLTEYILCYTKNNFKSLPLSVELTTEGKKYPLNNAGNGITVLTFPANKVIFKCNDQIVPKGDMSEGNIITNLLDDVVIENGKNVNSFRLEGEWRYSQNTLNNIMNNNEDIVISKVPFRPNHIKKGGEIKKMKNMLTPNHYDMETNEDATEILGELLNGNYFNNPKPVKLLKTLVLSNTYINKNDIIMDFFSGSATTAHAVMQLNAEDGGHRKFIMVQLPEACEENSEAFKAGYKNICEIGKERIRRAGEKIKADNPLTTQDLDIGFRVFKVDSSNMNDVYYSAGEYTQDMLAGLEDNIKPDRTDLDLLFGCLLDWGLPISLPYISEQIENCTVHTYNDGDLIACFDENVPETVIKEIAKRKPLRAVFCDAGFGSSPEKINVTEIFKMLAPDTDIKVI